MANVIRAIKKTETKSECQQQTSLDGNYLEIPETLRSPFDALKLKYFDAQRCSRGRRRRKHLIKEFRLLNVLFGLMREAKLEPFGEIPTIISPFPEFYKLVFPVEIFKFYLREKF